MIGPPPMFEVTKRKCELYYLDTNPGTLSPTAPTSSPTTKAPSPSPTTTTPTSTPTSMPTAHPTHTPTLQPTVSCALQTQCENCTALKFQASGATNASRCHWNLQTEVCTDAGSAACKNSSACTSLCTDQLTQGATDATGAIAGGMAAGCAVIGAFVLGFFWKRKKDAEFRAQALEMGSMSKSMQDIDFDSLTIGQTLGQGAFGEVKEAIFQGQDVAVKFCSSTNESDLEEFKKEIYINSLLPRHTNVVTMLGVTCGTRITMVMELYPLCSIADYLDKQKRNEVEPQSFAVLVKFAIDVSAGLLNLHDEGVVHSDVACRNVLVKTNYAGAAVADFGLSKILAKGDQVVVVKGEKLPVNTCAPEIMTDRQFSKKSDVYMFGLFLWELFAQCQPFYEYTVFQECRKTNKWRVFRDRVCGDNLRPSIPADWPSTLRNLISLCWDKNPDARPSMNSVNILLRKFQTIEVKAQNLAAPSCVQVAKDNEDLPSYYADLDEQEQLQLPQDYYASLDNEEEGKVSEKKL